MRDVELLVRYFAYKNFITSYTGKLKEFLDSTCQQLNQQWNKRENEIKRQAEHFERAIAASFKIFGKESVFRKWDGARFERRFNRAVFDIMVYYFSERSVRTPAVQSKQAVKGAFKELCETNPGFLRSLETSTKSIQATSTRLSRWGRALKKLGIPVRIPDL